MIHESLARHEDLRLPSNRSFGFGGAILFVIIGLLPLLWGNGMRYWSFAVAAVIALVTLAAANALTPLNRAWMRLGLLLNRIVNPVVLGIMFYAAVLPVGLVLRALRKLSLREGYDAGAATYWIRRTPPGPAPRSLERQF